MGSSSDAYQTTGALSPVPGSIFKKTSAALTAA
jgi:hypothetical protein